MQTVIDIVDMLQLQETWVRLPVVRAFGRLSQRESLVEGDMTFSSEWLQGRLYDLRRLAAQGWHRRGLLADPSTIPLGDLSDGFIRVLYPEIDSPAVARQRLFHAVYHRYVMRRYAGAPGMMGEALGTLVPLLSVQTPDCLNAEAAPQEGSSFWIPPDLTDEIRLLDSRHDISEPGTPAAYVIADAFWEMLVKVTTSQIDAAADCCEGDEARECLQHLVEIALLWSRSPSVVGLCYQARLA